MKPINYKPHKKEENKLYEIWSIQGNQLSTIKCRDILFPGNTDNFLIALEIFYPQELSLHSMYIPKQLLVLVKEYDEPKENKKGNLVVLQNANT